MEKATIFNYKKQIEKRDAELDKARQEKLKIMIDTAEQVEQIETEKQQLTEQVATATAQAEETSAKLQELKKEVITNFEGLARQINNEIPVTSENIHTIPTVEACLNLISGSIAQMPIYLYKKKKKTLVENDNRVKLLNDKPNKIGNSFNLKKNMVVDYLIEGSTTVSIERKDFKLVNELYYIPRKHVIVQLQRNGYKAVGADFVVTTPGEGQQNGSTTQTVPLENMICVIKDATENNQFVGMGILKTGRHILQQALHENRYLQSLYLNGAALRGILSIDGRLSIDAIEKIRQQLRVNQTGNNAGVPLILEEGAKFDSTTMTPVDLEFVKSRQETDTQIFRLFNIPEGMTTKDGNSNFDDTNRFFVRNTLGPIIKAIEAELNASLLLDYERDELEFKFDTSELERATEADRIKMFIEASGGPILTTNEAREALDYPRIEAGADDLQKDQSAVMMDTKTGKKELLNAGRVIDGKSTDESNDKSTEKQNDTVPKTKLTEEVKHE